ncbi:MAG: hypothetical protein Q8M95_02100 [Candidatus Methanoperedens sp.]|nr:hypothetical protein [Candidatus Methanoperedens sp.]
MANSLRHLVGSVQNVNEIGIIENTQVINIIDSVVQRMNFNIEEGINSKDINIKNCMSSALPSAPAPENVRIAGRKLKRMRNSVLSVGRGYE